MCHAWERKRYSCRVTISGHDHSVASPPISSVAIVLIPVGVILGTLAAFIAFLINSEIGLNALYPLNVGGLLVSVSFGLIISLLVTGLGLAALVISARVWPGRSAPLVLGLAIGCLIGGLVGSLLIRDGLDSWAEAIFESEIVGVSEAVVLALIVGIRQAITLRRSPAHV
jgi:hypothetical protein